MEQPSNPPLSPQPAAFEYVVLKREQEKLCFGTKSHRVVLKEPKQPGTCGPGSYNPLPFKKPRSKKGIPGLANSEKRKLLVINSITPGPNRYTIEPQKPHVQNCVPFNISSPKFKILKNNLPGPTVYNAHKVKKCKRTRMNYNFGHPCLVPAVEYVCINYPTEKCEKCGTPFEYGDHWHRNYAVYLCGPCMEEEHKLEELYKKRELLNFKKIRTCAFMHRHEGTSAAVKLMTQNKLDKKIRLENYLSLYFQCHGTKSRTELVVPYNDVM